MSPALRAAFREIYSATLPASFHLHEWWFLDQAGKTIWGRYGSPWRNERKRRGRNTIFDKCHASGIYDAQDKWLMKWIYHYHLWQKPWRRVKWQIRWKIRHRPDHLENHYRIFRAALDMPHKGYNGARGSGERKPVAGRFIFSASSWLMIIHIKLEKARRGAGN